MIKTANIDVGTSWQEVPVGSGDFLLSTVTGRTVEIAFGNERPGGGEHGHPVEQGGSINRICDGRVWAICYAGSSSIAITEY